MAADHIYTFTVWPVQVAMEFTYEGLDLDLPIGATAEQALYHASEKLREDPLAFIPVPSNLFLTMERSDGDTYSTGMTVEISDEEDDE